MRRFRFRLESILALRQKEADQKRLELGAVAQRCDTLSRRIEEHRRERQDTLTHGAPEGAADIAFRIAAEAYAARLERDARELEQRLAEAQAQREEAAETYRLARQKADVLERLRSRREEDHLEVEKREAQMRLDEVAQRMSRKSGQRE